jgi:hypothetical protein
LLESGGSCWSFKAPTCFVSISLLHTDRSESGAAIVTFICAAQMRLRPVAAI